MHQVVFEVGGAVRITMDFSLKILFSFIICQCSSIILFYSTGWRRRAWTADNAEWCVCVEVFKYGLVLCTKFCCGGFLLRAAFLYAKSRLQCTHTTIYKTFMSNDG